MSKLVVSDIASDYASKQKINSNFDAVVAAIENTLSRDGESPNEMGADLDMNSNRILNLPAPVADQEPLRLIDGQSILDAAQADADAAAASAAASASSASSSSSSASDSATSASEAAASAADAAAVLHSISADLWVRPVIDFITQAALNALSPSAGDRYLVTDGVNINQVAEYFTSDVNAWLYSGAPLEGQILSVSATGKLYLYSTTDSDFEELQTGGSGSDGVPITLFGAVQGTDIAAACAAGWAVTDKLFIPEGTGWVLDSNISPGVGQGLVGNGSGPNTILTIRVSDDGTPTTSIILNGEGAYVADLHIRAGAIPASGATGVCNGPIQVRADHCKVRNVFFEGQSVTNRFVKCILFAGISSGQSYTVTGTEITGNRGTWTHYFVIEDAGYTAHYTRISHNTVYNTIGEFCEFNGGRVDAGGAVKTMTKGLMVTNNYVDNIGYAGNPTGLTSSSERRFVGATCVDTVTISNNLIHRVFGDAPVHLERVGTRAVVSDNQFVDCHGSLGQALWFVGDTNQSHIDGTAGPDFSKYPVQDVVFTGNVVLFTDAYNASNNDSKKMITNGGTATNTRVTITDNVFAWYNNTGSGTTYPSEPTMAEVTTGGMFGISFNRMHGPALIERNHYINLANGIQVSNNTTQGLSDLTVIRDETFHNCLVGVLTSALSSNIKELRSCMFSSCPTPLNLDTSNLPIIGGGHNFHVCGQNGAVTSYLMPGWLPNTYRKTVVSCTTTSGSAVLTQGASPTLVSLFNCAVGAPISGTGIQAGSTIVSVANVAGVLSITMSLAATATANGVSCTIDNSNISDPSYPTSVATAASPTAVTLGPIGGPFVGFVLVRAVRSGGHTHVARFMCGYDSSGHFGSGTAEQIAVQGTGGPTIAIQESSGNIQVKLTSGSEGTTTYTVVASAIGLAVGLT